MPTHGYVPGLSYTYAVDADVAEGHALARGTGDVAETSSVAGEKVLGIAEYDSDARVGTVAVQTTGRRAVSAAAGVSFALDQEAASNGDGALRLATPGDAIVGVCRKPTDAAGGKFTIELYGPNQPTAA